MKRGRYGEFLRDDSKDIPRTSLFQINNRQARQEEQRIDEHQEQPNQAEENVAFEEVNGPLSETESENSGSESASSNSDNIEDRTLSGDETSDSSEEEELANEEFVPEEREHDDGAEHEPRQPIYEGCNITVQESRLLIMGFALRFGLSDLAIENLCRIVDCHLPFNVHRSFHHFKKQIPAPPIVETRYYCCNEKCQIPVQFEDDINIEECECQQVNNIHDLKKTGSYFLYLPLKDQLVSMLSDETVRRELRWEDDSESDVISGQLYKSLLRRGVVRKERDLTIQFNTDGVEAFKSSSVQMWPIQVCVNELPFKFRKENIILCGLWYDYCKPNMNTFLAPFIEELNSLRQVGFKVNPNDPHFIKVHTLLSSVDSMARAPLQNIQYVRGESSCSFCLHPGEDVAVGEGSARCFLGDIYPLRTNAQHLRDVNRVQADPTLKHVNGVKGPSALLLLDGFDIANSFVPDYLHCVLLGVVKTMVDKCWLATSNHVNVLERD
ncbi:Cyclic nucleotide-gated cation channel beta-3 [Frankliniella fusca]|uniref:Cyclic nucleotide-gated cation channel beta-3 n=1 Tax=Frankliniella fusca TaxID=407009 RepID=A0AAE1H8G7_9NEOP|nr:Cyclic nucleotide-gated cation channel beta-3 [Frankliniella fusca]KAK3916757.1 Cyclic nucleotide-gated cation channel beta-3 [Frankliniella fusca]